MAKTKENREKSPREIAYGKRRIPLLQVEGLLEADYQLLETLKMTGLTRTEKDAIIQYVRDMHRAYCNHTEMETMKYFYVPMPKEVSGVIATTLIKSFQPIGNHDTNTGPVYYQSEIPGFYIKEWKSTVNEESPLRTLVYKDRDELRPVLRRLKVTPQK